MNVELVARFWDNPSLGTRARAVVPCALQRHVQRAAVQQGAAPSAHCSRLLCAMQRWLRGLHALASVAPLQWWAMVAIAGVEVGVAAAADRLQPIEQAPKRVFALLEGVWSGVYVVGPDIQVLTSCALMCVRAWLGCIPVLRPLGGLGTSTTPRAKPPTLSLSARPSPPPAYPVPTFDLLANFSMSLARLDSVLPRCSEVL